jgi:predicted transcriptional regulator
VAGKGKYRLLDTHIVEPLKQRGWIVESKSGRNKILELADDGASALQAFRWMTEEIDWEMYLEEEFDEDTEES